MSCKNHDFTSICHSRSVCHFRSVCNFRSVYHLRSVCHMKLVPFYISLTFEINSTKQHETSNCQRSCSAILLLKSSNFVYLIWGYKLSLDHKIITWQHNDNEALVFTVNQVLNCWDQSCWRKDIRSVHGLLMQHWSKLVLILITICS